MTVESGPRIAYEPALRALGARLDKDGPAWFALVEMEDGYSLIMEARGPQPMITSLKIGVETLDDEARGLARGRRILGSHYRGSAPLFPTGRQDFLRSLGYELDDTQARNIVISQLDDSVLVTFSRVDAAHGYNWRKHSIVLQEDGIEELLQSAYERRRRRGFRRR